MPRRKLWINFVEEKGARHVLHPLERRDIKRFKPSARVVRLAESPMRFLLVLALLSFVRLTQAAMDKTIKPLPQISFSFAEFTQSREEELNFEAKARIGNMTLRNNVLELTPGAESYENTNRNSKADVKGSVFYKQPLRFVGAYSTASFRTSFTLVMKPVYPSDTGDGIVFVITSQPKGNGDSWGNFGFFHHGRRKHATLAIEFDSFKNHELFDIDSNHVGVDLDDPVSKAQVSAHSVGISLNNGRPITAWIDYSAPQELLEVRIQIGTSNRSKPEKALIVLPFATREVMEQDMWVGFSAGTHYGYNQLHYIYSWSFSVDDIEPGHKRALLTRTGKIILIVVLCGSFLIFSLGLLGCRHCRAQEEPPADLEEDKPWGKRLAGMVLGPGESGPEETWDPEDDVPGVMANCLPFQSKKYHEDDEEIEPAPRQGCLSRMMSSPRHADQSPGDDQLQSDEDAIMFSNTIYTSDDEENDIIPVYPYDAYPDERIDSIAYSKPRPYKPANPQSRNEEYRHLQNCSEVYSSMEVTLYAVAIHSASLRTQ
ncbi:hypothetical protein MPTK1_3g06530 [Marchantia polymorpha subsp. ruderalis]|uniref:Legume lectin domain-containing protein n=2 Tax=Marchantia polymorpha TaxID=3197 RepID=A0AAF6AY20_MARPO|nr:hypothetical protein MARPO_0006s0122 [Marchantia polymorpha]BBN04654.1 hypothetical protein Mp_3g06530 [Marchantia polymorpha subsp. ruderalis]|eukprot:PTQ48092.1 hypothetical protein MARPO_0006s0122 [Marchantia polymorpha]